MQTTLANVATESVDAVKSAGAGVTDLLSNLLSPDLLQMVIKGVVALIVFIIGKWIAKFIGKMVGKGFSKSGMDEKLAKLGGFQSGGVGAGVGKFVYFALLLFLIMIVLNILGMQDAVAPLRGMFEKFLGFIPNLIGGGILLMIVLFIARIVKTLLANVMNGARVDERLGMTEGTPITSSVSSGLGAFILLLMLPSVFGAFKLPQISEPLTALVTKITDNIPSVLIGLILIAVGFLIARIVKDLIVNMLTAAGINDFPAKLGYKGNVGTGAKSPAGLIGTIAMVTIMVIIASQALSIMNLGMISEIGSEFLGGYFNILGAVIILGLAIFAANWAHGALAGRNAALASFVKYAVLIFAGFIALQRSGIATDITGLPFQAGIIATGFALGVGGAIAIGLGCREHAARLFSKWL